MRDVVRHAHVVQSTIQRRGACSSKILHPMIGCHLEHTRGQDMVLYIQHKVQHTLSAVASRCFSLNYSVLRFWLSAKSRENQVLAPLMNCVYRAVVQLSLPKFTHCSSSSGRSSILAMFRGRLLFAALLFTLKLELYSHRP